MEPEITIRRFEEFTREVTFEKFSSFKLCLNVIELPLRVI